MCGRLLSVTQKTARAVKEAFRAPGIMLLQLNGAAAGQTVFHLHFHVIPRADGLSLRFHARDMEKPETLAKHAEMIRAAWKD
jgi:histidine triad (HIT) family protein